MRTDFAAFILTHGRPHNVYTYTSLRQAGYTGRIVIVLDDEDPTAPEYRRLFGDQCVTFCKAEAARQCDEGDNFTDRRAILYARNASFDIARRLGLRYFVQLDDDYTDFRYKRNSRGEYNIQGERSSQYLIRSLDAVFEALLDFYASVPALSLAMAQGGDFVGGPHGNQAANPRKCMNTFFCSVDRPFKFFGRLNEDVNAYTNLGSRGGLFLTHPHVAIQQERTQQGTGGMTDLYLSGGTYVKSFYSVMYQPSSVRISTIGLYPRIHHKVRWRFTVPVILDERHRRSMIAP